MMTNQDMGNSMLEIGCQQYEVCRIANKIRVQSPNSANHI
jgi:hypothetical protein